MIGVVRLSHARQSFRTFRRPVAAVALGVLAAGSVVACSSGPDQPKSVAEEFASALTSDDVQAAAALTTDPAAASTAISALIDGLGKDEEHSPSPTPPSPVILRGRSHSMRRGSSVKVRTGTTRRRETRRKAGTTG
ncbi:hypothetical protein N806_25970 [Rhodococcus sp. P27]|nr:hypothetical protein N806_25970 [Rhodococcus sp. P27]